MPTVDKRFTPTNDMAGTLAGSFNVAMEHSHDPRYCRTHAFVAELYAAHARGTSAGDSWKFLAGSWSELADIKSRNAALDQKTRKLISEVYGAPFNIS